jgi:PLP dependent protein
MAVNVEQYRTIVEDLSQQHVQLVAVSKVQPVEAIQQLYNEGQRDFGENYVQELVDKHASLPQDIRWHFIGHLQSNKVKYISSFVHLVHGVDSLNLLTEINKQGKKINRIIPCLLQVHIAQEETKFGLDAEELKTIVDALQTDPKFQHVHVQGFMGMASFSDDQEKVRKEFKTLKNLFDVYKHIDLHNFRLTTLSIGMSGDYTIAIEEGSNMVRIGSLLFGARR